MLKEYSISDIVDSLLQHVSFYTATFEGTEDPDIKWPHRHSFFSLVWFTQGTGFYVIDFEEYEIKADRIFLVNPRQIHNWDYSENSKGYILMVDSTPAAEMNLNPTFPYMDMDKKMKGLPGSMKLNTIQVTLISSALKILFLKTIHNPTVYSR